MDLYKTIYQLVCDNDCVIIPGFGGFVANRFPANIDFSKQEFYPPSRKVAFNESLSLSDGLLMNHISQTENVSWADADNIVRSFVDELNTKLADDKSVSFEGLGEFSRRTGSLVFTSNSANLLDESFGLTTFNFPILHSASKPRIESAIIKGTPDKKGKKGGKGHAIAWSLSAVAVIAGLVCMSLYMGWFDKIFGNGGDENTMLAGFGVNGNTEQVVEVADEVTADEQVAVFADAQEAVVEDTEMIEAVSEELLADEEIAAEEVVATDEPVAVNVEATVDETSVCTDFKVHIIAGCFANYSNAENVYKDLSSRGLSPQILPLHKGLYKVSVKGFATTSDACAELQALKELTGNDQLWVMKM